jgi:hypothetical protein
VSCEPSQFFLFSLLPQLIPTNSDCWPLIARCSRLSVIFPSDGH